MPAVWTPWFYSLFAWFLISVPILSCYSIECFENAYASHELAAHSHLPKVFDDPAAQQAAAEPAAAAYAVTLVQQQHFYSFIQVAPSIQDDEYPSHTDGPHELEVV